MIGVRTRAFFAGATDPMLIQLISGKTLRG
jgi:hypothetical protein